MNPETFFPKNGITHRISEKRFPGIASGPVIHHPFFAENPVTVVTHDSERTIQGAQEEKNKIESVFPNIIGRHPKMQDIYQQIREVARFDCPVHISGETGTGKELVANAIHLNSPRKKGPLVPINCGALPENLIESELFGYVKGAFSGAIRDKKGRLELAHGGTVFLDEVAELSKYMQVKLLRFLQDGTVEKIGNEKTTSVDVRVISATNKDLKQEMQRNRFREDLFYRIHVVPIELPKLSGRKSDIPLLVQHFLREIEQRYQMNPISISGRALELLSQHKWPGNVRELQNAIQYAFIKSQGMTIQPENLPIEISGGQKNRRHRGPTGKLDTESVQAALSRTGGNKARAARQLGVGRATLYRFLDKYESVQLSAGFDE